MKSASGSPELSISVLGRWALLAGSLWLGPFACGHSANSGRDEAGGQAGNSGGAQGAVAAGGAAASAGSRQPSGSAGVGAGAGAGDSTAAAGAQPTTSEGGAAGGAVGGESAGGESAGSAGASTLAPHTCGIFSRLALPDVPASPEVGRPGAQGGTRLANDFMRREDGGFAVGPWFEPDAQGNRQTTWLRADLRDRTQAKHTANFSSGLAQVIELLPVGASNNLLVVGSSFHVTGYATSLFVAGGDANLSQVDTLFDGDYGTGRFVQTWEGVSLDGQRALFVTRQVTERPARLALIAADGTRVGNVLELTGEYDCLTVLPTEHALAIALMDGADLHLIEFSAAGDVALDVKLPLHRTQLNGRWSCPKLALSDSGFAVFSYEEPNALGDNGSESAWDLHRLERDGSSTADAWYGVSNVIAFTVQGDRALALVDQPGLTLTKRTANGSQSFPVALRPTAGFAVYRPILSEAGSLFLDLEYSLDFNSPHARQIVELGCAD